jgi:hypothetical protein
MYVSQLCFDLKISKSVLPKQKVTLYITRRLRLEGKQFMELKSEYTVGQQTTLSPWKYLPPSEHHFVPSKFSFPLKRHSGFIRGLKKRFPKAHLPIASEVHVHGSYVFTYTYIKRQTP